MRISINETFDYPIGALQEVRKRNIYLYSMCVAFSYRLHFLFFSNHLIISIYRLNSIGNVRIAYTQKHSLLQKRV